MLLLIFISFYFYHYAFNLKDYPDKIGCWQEWIKKIWIELEL